MFLTEEKMTELAGKLSAHRDGSAAADRVIIAATDKPKDARGKYARSPNSKRAQIQRYVEAGKTKVEILELMNISKRALRDHLEKLRDQGRI